VKKKHIGVVILSILFFLCIEILIVSRIVKFNKGKGEFLNELIIWNSDNSNYKKQLLGKTIQFPDSLLCNSSPILLYFNEDCCKSCLNRELGRILKEGLQSKVIVAFCAKTNRSFYTYRHNELKEFPNVYLDSNHYLFQAFKGEPIF